ncbi:MAG: hypothetical protein C0609_11030 [Deltaproteobacteria bacterium]|mgnify:CR=1 FL=1|nr:MAG: hypothetical protein C0609_11030 [Deltaproteobacteria bacterium]
MNSGDDKTGIENIESMIDQAIDDLFVPSGGASKADPAQMAKVEAEPPQEEPDEAVDMDIAWGNDDKEEAVDFSEVVEAGDSEGAPSLDILRPLHEALLSLDWEINLHNIDALDEEYKRLGAMTQDNMHAQNAVKMASVCCKYLRASKSLASPLALKFLKTTLDSLDIFLRPPAPNLPSKDALVNEMMGLYNEMKLDANRLRAAALKKREAKGFTTTQQKSAATTAAPSSTSSADLRSELAHVKRTLRDLVELVDKIERALV